MKTLSFLFVLAAASLTAVTAPVEAQTVTATRPVSTAGLDLGTEAGIRALDLRILHAASELCGTPSAALPRSATAFAKCRTEARANAARTRELAIRRVRGDLRVASSR